MNVVFEKERAESEVRKYAPGACNNGSNADRMAAAQVSRHGIFALDISGTAKDNTAYGDQGKTMEDVMQDAGQADVAVQKDYMIVMSNVMSDEDFAKLQEEGYHPGDTEIETVVTIVDEIKAALIRGGSNIAGYTDDLDMETLAEITGSVAFAEQIVKQFGEYDIPVTEENAEAVMQAYDTVQQLKPLSDGTVKYMIRNQMEPTVDNIYRAQYSSLADAGKQGRGYYQDEAGYYAKKAEVYDWQQLQPQMEKVIEQAGLEVSEETLDDARWLIEKGMPLTEESLHAFYELKNLKIPDSAEEIIAAASAAIADGKKAVEANIGDGRSALEKAAQYVEDVHFVSDEAVDRVVAEGKKLNLRILKASQMRLNQGLYGRHYEAADSVRYESRMESRRLLEEVRLQMTVEANYRLIKSGFSIDTAHLEELVDALKAVNERTGKKLFGEDGVGGAGGRMAVYKDTMSTVRELAGMPAALVGRFSFQSRLQIQAAVASPAGQTFTLRSAYEAGAVLRSAYEKAGESYEALLTGPRVDLGDSIEKAFRNVDDLLRDMGMETSEANRRAVRILGYNHMEVTAENVVAVKTTDLSVQRVLNKMTPAATMQMIRDGVNPLAMDMAELENYLNNQDRNPEQELEKYSKYLYKLEKNHSVTKEEKEAYIGIYRLLRQLEKTDGAAIGALMQQGVEPTLKNLLTAVRSSKRRGMDIKIDDGFERVEYTRTNKSISEQIESNIMIQYYKKLASEIYDRIDGDKMGAVPADGDMNLEQAAQALWDAQQDEDTEKEYVKQQASRFRQEAVAEDTVIRELLDFRQPITADNLAAAGLLMRARGRAALRLYELADENGGREELEQAASRLQESMGDADSAKEAYAQLEETYRKILEVAAYEQEDTGRIDIREFNSLYKQVALSGSMAREENYEVPVKIGGEVTSINLKIVHKDDENGKVIATMDTERYGKVAAQFRIFDKDGRGYQTDSYIICEDRQAADVLRQSGEELKKMLGNADIETAGMNVIQSGGLDLAQVFRTSEREEDPGMAVRERMPKAARNTVPKAGQKPEFKPVSTKKLYEAAKIFIQYMQER